MARILILSAHTVFQQCLGQALEARECLQQVPCSSGKACLEELQRGDGDLVLVDVEHPVPGLLDVVRGVEDQSAKVLLLGLDTADATQGLRYLEHGADGSLPLEASLQETCDAIERVLAGEKVYPPSIAYRLYEHLADRSRRSQRNQLHGDLLLTPRELEILRCIAQGSSNDAIASELQISVHTVKNHVHHILEKMAVEDRGAAAQLASQQGWLDPPSTTWKEN